MKGAPGHDRDLIVEGYLAEVRLEILSIDQDLDDWKGAEYTAFLKRVERYTERYRVEY